MPYTQLGMRLCLKRPESQQESSLCIPCSQHSRQKWGFLKIYETTFTQQPGKEFICSFPQMILWRSWVFTGWTKLVEEVSQHPRFDPVAWTSWMIFFRFRLRMVIKAWSKGRENLKIWSWARKAAHSKTKAEGWVTLSPLWSTSEFCSETVGKCHSNVPRLACRAYHRAVMRV